MLRTLAPKLIAGDISKKANIEFGAQHTHRIRLFLITTLLIQSRVNNTHNRV